MPATETGARPRRSPRSSRPLRPSRPWLRAVLALSGWAALAATALPGGSPARWVPVLVFVAVGPGCALLLPQPPADRLRPAARMEVVALAAPLSLSLATLDATALHLVAGFSVPLFLGSLAAFCTAAALLPGLPLPAATRGAVERERPRDGRSGSRNSAVGDR